ncbi:DUF4411 family protein [Bifidobacterium bohemicum]|uniref:DUF4411 family protein n=1 Tax=Bifidobacterium bohemicum DSM 22767 TaxID=1437606 RepID=A0A086ZGN7_9BIFI|nr:DUF4411 family protein [Bifidobacterium bohemicum]KFI45687.1 hypothetical protein BBOH_0488 [Bifidobacterium bohemicum DSM 22767]
MKPIREGKHLDDDLKHWLESVKSYVIEPLQIVTIMDKYRRVLACLSDRRNFKEKLNSNWYDQATADPWLIAVAIIYNSSIITFETPMAPTDPKPWKKTKIPSVAELMEVKCVNLYQFMEEVGSF